LWRRMAPFAEFVMTKGLVRACHTMLEVMGRPAAGPDSTIVCCRCKAYGAACDRIGRALAVFRPWGSSRVTRDVGLRR
jgi:hypothetical protein